MSSLLRLTGVTSEFYLDGRNHDINFLNSDRFDSDAALLRINAFSTSHKSLSASSVFNFYSPDYSPSNEFTDKSLVSPETELLVETSQVDTINDIFLLIRDGSVNKGARLDAYSLTEAQQRVWLNSDRATEIWNDTEGDDHAKASALVDYLDFYYNVYPDDYRHKWIDLSVKTYAYRRYKNWGIQAKLNTIYMANYQYQKDEGFVFHSVDHYDGAELSNEA